MLEDDLLQQNLLQPILDVLQIGIALLQNCQLY